MSWYKLQRDIRYIVQYLCKTDLEEIIVYGIQQMCQWKWLSVTLWWCSPHLVYIYICVCVCVYVCVYIYIYIYTHTHTYISLMYMWPCIVTNFFVIKPTRCTNFTNLFCHETLHVSDSSSVHHQEFIHCTLGTGVCHTPCRFNFVVLCVFSNWWLLCLFENYRNVFSAVVAPVEQPVSDSEIRGSQ